MFQLHKSITFALQGLNCLLGDYSTAKKSCLTPCSWLWTVPDIKKLKAANPKENPILDQLKIQLENPDHFMQSTRCTP